jgi:hypothetical protein
MVSQPKGQRHFKADAAAEAAAGERLGGDRRSVHDATIVSVLRDGELSDESPGRRSPRKLLRAVVARLLGSRRANVGEQ